MAIVDDNTQRILQADYQGPADTKEFQHPIGSLSLNHSVKDKTEYLSTLRASIVKMQDEINVFLTEKMEEDNSNSKAVDDQKEEENYGEEVVDEE
ncbi:MAG: hypothetical protein MMC23_005915 [Stictis urceolatum]|nr:hypothetical protein [Stictis urceolata]